MTELALANRLARIVVYGHILLFVLGFAISFWGTVEAQDARQLILIGSPLLALVSTAAFEYIMRMPAIDNSALVNPGRSQMATVVTSVFVLLLFVAYSTAMFHTPLSADEIKFSVAAIETALGAYIGTVRDVFFPKRA